VLAGTGLLLAGGQVVKAVDVVVTVALDVRYAEGGHVGQILVQG
ncbi:uncharacterized protein METZ01_LOCUS393602, partial [marine metagenome]